MQKCFQFERLLLFYKTFPKCRSSGQYLCHLISALKRNYFVAITFQSREYQRKRKLAENKHVELGPGENDAQIQTGNLPASTRPKINTTLQIRRFSSSLKRMETQSQISTKRCRRIFSLATFYKCSTPPLPFRNDCHFLKYRVQKKVLRKPLSEQQLITDTFFQLQNCTKKCKHLC